MLRWFGRRAAARQAAAGFAGAEVLLGVTDPRVDDPEFFARWLAAAPGRVVELCCHPGHFDPTLAGRDGTLADGLIHRRPREFELLARPAFLGAVRANGFELVTAARLTGPAPGARRAA
ncbi:MAG: hypothetical protein FJ304_08910 [Planctomycetes bacterium]|nr:hypothetical protein [Planctomycetota bacterium]